MEDGQISDQRCNDRLYGTNDLHVRVAGMGASCETVVVVLHVLSRCRVCWIRKGGGGSGVWLCSGERGCVAWCLAESQMILLLRI